LANSIVIYTRNPTQRHHYVFNLVFSELLGVPYQITQDPENQNIQLNYSTNSSILGFYVKPVGLLSEQKISVEWPEKVKFDLWDELPLFFKTDAKDWPFDVFSAIFYCVSRYEEYLDFPIDVHNRFTAEQSFLLKNDVMHLPLVNKWVLALGKALKNKFSELELNPRKFQYISTIDIDQAWKFKHKGLARNIVGTFRDLATGKWENLLDRWPTLIGLKEDAFYNFDWQNQVHEKYKIAVKYFILLGDLGGFDKNISHKNKAFRCLINRLLNTQNCEVGIHPSYKSNTPNNRVKEEVKRLKDITGRDVILSRQHFLMHKMPNTYQNLIELGIVEEHTMGYSTHLGFRAGIAAPFYFFDLTKNESTNLKLYPFCAMDITPLHYMKQNPDEAIETLTELMNEVKAVNGLFVSLWHNESFSETERWKGWRKVYEALLSKAVKK